jgi:hypothetical protein
MMKLYYLASPYTHTDEIVKDRRAHDAALATKYLLEKHAGVINILSPIVHSHVLHRAGMEGTWETWKAIDTDFIARCDGIVVLMLPGWDISVGVSAEIKIAAELGKQIFYLPVNPDYNYEPFGPLCFHP